jgi:hypothetical protein
MKVAPAPAAATISTAASARGIRQRSRKTCGWRQHGADDEGHRDRQKKSLGQIETGDDADDEEADEGDRHHFGAADDRRQFAFAVRDRGAFVRAGKRAFAGQGFCWRRFGSQRLGSR